MGQNRLSPLLLFITSLTSIAAHADFIYQSSSLSCSLKKHVGQTWIDADSSELAGMTFKNVQSFPPPSKYSLVRANGVLYSAPSDCFGSAEAGAAPTPEPTPEPQATPEPTPTQKPAERQRPREENIEPTGPGITLELNGGIYKDLTSASTAHTVTYSNGVSGSIGETKYDLGYGMRLGYPLNENSHILLKWFRYSGKSSTAFTGTATGTMDTIGTRNTFLLGYEGKFFESGPFSTYFGIDLGYGIEYDSFAISGFTGALTGLNGNLDVKGAGLSYALELGAHYEFMPHLGLCPIVQVLGDAIKTGTVSNSTSSLYGNGATVTANGGRALILILGLRYTF